MEIPVPVQPSWLRRASAPLPGFSAPGRLFDQRFGEGLLESELASLCPAAIAPYYLRAPSVALPTAQVPDLGEGTTQLLTGLAVWFSLEWGYGNVWILSLGKNATFQRPTESPPNVVCCSPEGRGVESHSSGGGGWKD